MGIQTTMELLSQTYGWTPNQIRKQRPEDIEQYIEILAEKQKIAKGQAFKNKH